MKVLLTGGAGYVGSVAARGLLRLGHEVRVVDALMYGSVGLLGLYGEDRFSFLRGDIRSAPLMRRALEGIDAVVHLAAIVGDPACARQPDVACDVNRDASLQLLALSQQQGVQRLVFASTCSNYGTMADATQYMTEESELRPVSLYAETKVAVERALLTSSAAAPAVCVLRFATVFGLSPRMRFDLTVNEFTMELLTKRTVTVYTEHRWRPYVHVRDAARAIGLALDSSIEHIRGQAFNVGETRHNYQKGQLVELIRAQIGNHVTIERVTRPDDPRDYRVLFEKIKRELGFQVDRTVEDGVREIADAIGQGLFSDCGSPSYRN